MKNSLLKYGYIIMWLICGQTLTSNAQDIRRVEGLVFEASSGDPIPGASLLEDGTTNGTITDLDGRFSIQLTTADPVLVVSFIGFETQLVKVGTNSQIEIQLKEDMKNLDEVIVIGYGTQKKSDVTGAVSSLRADDFNKGLNATFDQMLVGKAAGVQVVQNSGEPGSGIAIRVRGSSSINAGSSPLYVVDGLPLDNSPPITGGGAHFDASQPRNPLSSINPADIESIEILKDASATAIYGARGANGVVMITTKRGKEGRTTISYNSYVGVQNVANKIKLLSAEEYRVVLNGIIADGGGSPQYMIPDGPLNETDWQDELFRRNAAMHNHNLSFTGGNAKTNYFASFNYFKQDGVVQNSSFERYSAKLNLSTQASEKLEMGLNLNISYNADDFVPSGFGINAESGTIYSALNFDPTLPLRDSDGTYSLSPFLDLDNPLTLANGSDAQANTYRTFGTVYAKYAIRPGLTANLNLGGDILHSRRDVYVDRTTRHGGPQGGIATILLGQNTNYLVEGTLSYDKSWTGHQLNILAGVTTQRFVFDNISNVARNFPSDATETYNMGLGDRSTFVLGSGRASNSLLSYLGRINYEFKEKYLLTASFRADGSSRFGANNRFGYFPSFAAGWKLHEENFMSGSALWSTLKPRASWGQTGNQEIGNYAAISTFSAGPTAILNDNVVSTTNPARIANPNLRWETTEQTNLGLDFGLWGDRVYGGVDYFRKRTFDMLLNLPVPTSSGFNAILSNVGSVRNTGWEFSLTSRNFSGAFEWSTTVNMATLKNEVLDLGGLGQIITGNAGQTSQIFLLREGMPAFSFYGYQIDGIWQQGEDFSQTLDNVAPGDFKYRDVNGDNMVTAEDRVILGNSFPDFTWSIGNNLSYKNFNLNVFVEGVQGVSMLNNNLVDAYFPIQFRRNRFAEPYLNRWTPENPSDTYPSFVNPTSQGSKLVNSYTVEDASYVRIRTVTLSYVFPHGIKHISNLSVNITGENLFTFTGYSGYDPTVSPNGGAFSRVDFNAYPVSRNFILGISANF
ncbi:SusC/RagA family TonB-linked outer membrane protein [Negadavirga shengliensis]|uniref:SusC/RagA family TonB-linked outer membrane protein n=1 Tax=Negadavirga shengliensis TaxID=1389218 RepID=A0ABV9SXY3_9BACT